MATAGTLNGTIIAITIGGTKIEKQLGASFSFSHEPRTSITKYDASWETSRPGKKSWEASGEAENDFGSTVLDSLLAALIAGTEVTIDFTTDVSGDTEYTGTALVTKFDVDAGVEEDSKVSYSFKGTGAPTKQVVTP